ncbi:hypothetical protein [Bradyrhizobium symbiodeficiens]
MVIAVILIALRPAITVAEWIAGYWVSEAGSRLKKALLGQLG